MSAPNNLNCLYIPLTTWANHYGHNWTKDPSTGELLVPLDGVPTSWSTVAQYVLKDQKISSQWRYDEKGFRNISPFKWTHLEPDRHRASDGHYYFELVVAKRGHTHMRLIDGDGAEISFGFCIKDAFRTGAWKQGVLANQDPFAAFPYEETVTKIELSQVQWKALKQRVEFDKWQKRECAHLIKNNCSTYAAKILSESLGLQINADEYVDCHLTRVLFKRLGIGPLAPTAAKVMNVALTIIRCLLFPLYLLSYLILYLISGGPFASYKKVNQESYAKTFADEVPKPIIQRIKDAVIGFFTADFLYGANFFRLRVWQNEVAKMYHDHTPTLEELRRTPIMLPSGLNAQVDSRIGNLAQSAPQICGRRSRR